MSRMRGSSSTTSMRRAGIAASIAPGGVFSRKKENRALGLNHELRIANHERKDASATSEEPGLGGSAVAEFDDEELLHLLLQRLELRVGDHRVHDLGGLAVPGLLDAQLAVLRAGQADAALPREQQRRQLGDLVAGARRLGLCPWVLVIIHLTVVLMRS